MVAPSLGFSLVKLCCAELLSRSCPTLCDPADCSPPGSSVHEISQARILGGLPCPPPGDLPNPGVEPKSSALQVDSLPSEHTLRNPGPISEGERYLQGSHRETMLSSRDPTEREVGPGESPMSLRQRTARDDDGDQERITKREKPKRHLNGIE